MPSQKNKDFYQLFAEARFQKEKDLPFVIYQRPNELLVKAILPNTSNLVHASDFSESGFVFAPFDSKEKAILLSSKKILQADYEITPAAPDQIIGSTDNGKEFHLDLVNKALASIKNGALKKVVVSRRLISETKKDAFKLFEALLNYYPEAFKYLWYHPKKGMWLGATPETLLKIDGGVLTTTSLAGTLPVQSNQAPQWSSKEVEEQQLVTDYIVDALSDKLIDINVTEPTSVKAGKLWHLKSLITGSLAKELGLNNIIDALHPTPAVCGMPKIAAKEFLIANENYDREFYTGFLGEINLGVSRKTHLCVNLRSMKLEDTKASIFIGGGITEESNAESEWMETQHKSKTMLSLL